MVGARERLDTSIPDATPGTLSNSTSIPTKMKQHGRRRYHWGFMVVLGCFFLHVLLGGFNRCYGVIYLQLQDRFNSSAAVTAGVGGVSSALRMGSGPLATAISERIGSRLTVMIGGILLGLGSVLSSCIPSTQVAFLTLGLMSGIGGALTYIPSLVIVGQYFTKARSRALGVATSGSGIGVFLFPLMLEAIFNCYGYQGGMVLLGGILFNTVVCGALYRPLGRESKGNTEMVDMEADSNTIGEDVTNTEKNNCETKVKNGLTANQEGEKYCPSWCAGISQKIGLHLLKNRSFLSYCISMCLVTASYWPAQTLLPALATSKGHSQSHAILLLSLIGAFDVIGRLAGGVFFDLQCVRKRRLSWYLVSLVLTALTELAWPLVASSYPLLAILVALNGLAGGVVVCQKAVVAADLVGIEQLAGGLGLVCFSQGIGVIFGPPLAGLLRDITLSYTWSYVFVGIVGLAGAAVLAVGSVLPTCRTKKTKDAVPS